MKKLLAIAFGLALCLGAFAAWETVELSPGGEWTVDALVRLVAGASDD